MGETRSTPSETRRPLRIREQFGTREEGEQALARAQGLLAEALSAMDRGDPYGVGRALHELGTLAELDATMREMLAGVWLRCGEPAKAAAELEVVVKEKPDSLPGWRGLTEARVHMGAYAGALEAARECVRLSAREAGDLMNLGVCARKAGLEEEGRRCFFEAVELDPKLFGGWKNLGNSYRDANEPVEAERAYRRALELSPRRTDVWSDLAVALDLQGRSDAALAAFREVVHLSPDDPEGWFNLTSACCLNGRLPEARGAYLRLRALESGWARRACLHVAGIFEQLIERGDSGYRDGSPLATPEFWERSLGGGGAPAGGADSGSPGSRE